MTRYIDAEVLKNEDFQDFSNTDVMYAIDHCPTADVQEVKHGKWEKGKCGNYFVCSECGQISDFFKYDYCPGCGARMDGEDK